MAAQRPDDLHVIRLRQPDQGLHVPRRIHQQTLPGLGIADQVGEIHHLCRHRIIDGEISSGQQLAEVEWLSGWVMRHELASPGTESPRIMTDRNR
jgi:hypothetical protein